jgi:hypothetical protein
MPLTAADVDALFPPMSSANPTNSNINRALRIQAGLPPLTLMEAGQDVEEPEPDTTDNPLPKDEDTAQTPSQGMKVSRTRKVA